MSLPTTILLMGPLGVQELLLILVIILIVFGASKLPQLGKGLGEGIRNFKSGLKADDAPKAIDAEADDKKA